MRWGESVGRAVRRPVWFALRGELGAGKSVLARAVARGAGVRSAMPSPTFNLVFQYHGTEARVWHLDLFRITSADDVWELGWREFGGNEDIVLVEWPERAERYLPPDRWDIRLEPHPDDAELRIVTGQAIGSAPRVPPPVNG